MSNPAHFQRFVNSTRPVFCFGLVLFNLTFCLPMFAATSHETSELGINTVVHMESEAPAQNLEIDMPSPGIFSVEILQEPASSGPILLEIAPSETLSTVAILDRAVYQITLAVIEAGTLKLRVVAPDMQASLGSFRVTSHFAPTFARHQTFHIPPGSTGLWEQEAMATHTQLTSASGMTKTDLEEVDPNPGGLHIGPTAGRIEVVRIRAADSREKTDLEEVDPNPGGLLASSRLRFTAAWIHQGSVSQEQEVAVAQLPTHDVHATLQWIPQSEDHAGRTNIKLELNPIDFDLDPTTCIEELAMAVERTLLRPKRAYLSGFPGLCDERVGDSFLCAEPLSMSSTVDGYIDSGSNGGMKIYVLDVEEIEKLQVTVAGNSRLSGFLFRSSGEKITAEEGRHLSLIKHLEPGRYFLVLKGQYSGEYAIRTRRLS